MEAFHYMSLLQSCLLCVNETWHFVITPVSPQCVPHVFAAHGAVMASAEFKQDCRDMPYDMVPMPNITQSEFDEIMSDALTETTTTEMPWTTLERVTDLDRCLYCVRRGRTYVKVYTGQGICLLAYDDYDQGLVAEKASNPRKCQRVNWDKVILTTPTTPADDNLVEMTTLNSTELEAKMVYAVVGGAAWIVIGVIFGSFVLMVLGGFAYRRYFQKLEGEQEALVNGSGVMVRNVVFNRTTRENDEEDESMIEMVTVL